MAFSLGREEGKLTVNVSLADCGGSLVWAMAGPARAATANSVYRSAIIVRPDRQLLFRDDHPCYFGARQPYNPLSQTVPNALAHRRWSVYNQFDIVRR